MSEDILIRCKHYHSQTTRVPVFRIMFNTDFIFDNVARFYKVNKIIDCFVFFKLIAFKKAVTNM